MSARRTAPGPAEPPLEVYLGSPRSLETKDEANEFLADHQLLRLSRDDALQDALDLSPSAETPEELAAIVGAALGSIPGVSPPINYEPHVSFLITLRFNNLRLDSTEATEKAEQLAYAYGEDPLDALWVPEEPDDSAGPTLRLIASRERLEEMSFEVVSSSPVPARSRPLR
jgi:hypothetical protein